jgi:hypothetical protein
VFKRKDAVQVKQPQEYYCSNPGCLNEVADFSPLKNLLTDEAHNNYADFYCFDCIVEERFI